MQDFLQLYPKPKKMHVYQEQGVLTGHVTFIADQQAAEVMERVQLKERMKQIGAHEQHEQLIHLVVRQDDTLHEQGYTLKWTNEEFVITYHSTVGLHYALVTLEQLVQRHGDRLPYFEIEDEPDLKLRGFMLDIGRNKIPTMPTLYELIDEMSQMKLNHLQLHMEGYTFLYEKYQYLFPESTPITAQEFQQLDYYAAERFIDLVPNQNCFGHMGDWLSKPELRDLAEHPDGMATSYNITVPPVTLNPLDDQSIELVTNLFDELLPNFTSEYVNINFDEPFGLGTGKSKALAEEIGVGSVYIEFANKVFDIVRKHNKKILIWGDILTSYPETITQLPEDVTVLDWNYDAHTSFAKNAAYFDKVQAPFIVCCGTSSWSSVSGRTENMLDNITDAAVNGKRYSAEGLIVTDWGDNGHWQTFPISFPGMVYAAGVSWQVTNNTSQETAIEDYLNAVVFQDDNKEIGNLLMELGRYYHFENSSVENATFMNHLLNHGIITPEEVERKMNALMQIFLAFGGENETFILNYDYTGIREWLSNRKFQLKKIDLQITDAALVNAELQNTIRLLEHAIDLYQFNYEVNLQVKDKVEHVTMLKTDLEKIIASFNHLWLQRNRLGGLDKSNMAFYKLLDQYKTRLIELQNK